MHTELTPARILADLGPRIRGHLWHDYRLSVNDFATKYAGELRVRYQLDEEAAYQRASQLWRHVRDIS
jgi:hypothetical protein